MSKVPKKKVGPYVLGDVLGEGGFGKVRIAVHEGTSARYAVKVLDKKKLIEARCVDTVFREIAIMKRLKHRNIVDLIEVLHSDAHIYIVLELCSGGELFEKVIEVRVFEEHAARFLFQQLIDSIEYCHRMNVIHGDVKPENLLLTEAGTLKLSDFGLASIAAPGHLVEIAVGTQNYMAPEVVSRSVAYEGRPSDVWSAGCVLFVLLAGGMPFDETDDKVLADKILRGHHRAYPSSLTPGARHLLDQMLVPDPAARITIAGIKADPWFAVGYRPQELPPAEHALDVATVPLVQRTATTIRLRQTGPVSAVRDAVVESLRRVCPPTAVIVQADDKIRVLAAADDTPHAPSRTALLLAELFPSSRENEMLCVLQRRQAEPHLFADAARAIGTLQRAPSASALPH